LLPEGATILELPEERWGEITDESRERSRKLKGLESVLHLFKDFLLPLALESLEPLRAHVQTYAPDLLVVDQQALAGVVVARERGAPWVTMATTTASLFKMWDGFIEGFLDDFQQRLGLEPRVPRPDLSPHGVVALSTRELLGDVELYDVPYAFVGPSFSDRPQACAFPWDRLRADVPKVLVSLGTISIERGPRYFGTVMEGLAGQPLQVIMVAPPGYADEPPDNFLIQERVPQVALMPHLSTVVCHAGHTTVCEALAHGLPLVCTPIRDDQPVIARQVASAGAGLVLRFKRLRPGDVREAVNRVLSEPAFGEAAARIKASFERAGGAAAAARFMCARIAE
jgi:hypothetical protein